jgi:hypothetical protein
MRHSTFELSNWSWVRIQVSPPIETCMKKNTQNLLLLTSTTYCLILAFLSTLCSADFATHDLDNENPQGKDLFCKLQTFKPESPEIQRISDGISSILLNIRPIVITGTASLSNLNYPSQIFTKG